MTAGTNGSTNGNGVVNGNGVPIGNRPYRILDQPLGTRSQYKIIGIGAGASGLYLAYALEKQMKDYDLVIYEKNHDVGGTWLESTS